MPIDAGRLTVRSTGFMALVAIGAMFFIAEGAETQSFAERFGRLLPRVFGCGDIRPLASPAVHRGVIAHFEVATII